MKSLNQGPSAIRIWVLPVATITLFLCLKFLLVRNMGRTNELHHLPLSRHFVESTWLAKDIYYSEPPGYRLLFQLIFGPLTTTVGFLATSIIGRILGYCSLAMGFWSLARSLGMRLSTLLLAIGLLVYVHRPQGVIAGEWLIGSVEPKVFAYSAVFLALSALLAGRYLWMTASLGLATSFHALVGGWSTIAVFLLLLWRRRDILRDILLRGRRWLVVIPIYGLTSVFALTAVLTQLLSPIEASTIDPSYIYSFLRNPHHVSPMAWSWDEWLLLPTYLLVLGASVPMATEDKIRDETVARNRQDFLGFVLCTLTLFGAGVLVAPLDLNGKILQYYPFRVGDLMLAVGASFFLALALEKLLLRYRRGMLALTLAILIGFGAEATQFYTNAVALKDFPSKDQGVDSQMLAMANWLKQEVPTGEVVISSPVDLKPLPWLSERSSVAKFLFVPSASSADVEIWFERMSDLGGGIDLLSYADRRSDARHQIRTALRSAYNSLDTAQMINLMEKYQSSYVVTNAGQKLALPLLYENPNYRVYGAPKAGPN